MYGRGFRSDRPDAYPSHRRIGALAPILPIASHMAYRRGPVYQDGVNMCVACALKRAVQLWHAIRGHEVPMLSDRAAYVVGRAEEYAGVVPELITLEDGGAIPEMLMRGVQRVGLVAEDAYPGPATLEMLTPSEVNAQPGPDVLCRAYDARGLAFHALDASGGFREAVRGCLSAGLPVILAINADGLAAHDPGSTVVTIPPSHQDHMVLVLDASDPDTVRCDNWWGRPSAPWGDLSTDETVGTWRTLWASLEAGASNAIVMDMAPLVRPS